MIIYFLSSITPTTHAIVVTRHFSPLEAEREKLRRLSAGHGHFSMQQVEATPPTPGVATKPRKGGAHGA